MSGGGGGETVVQPSTTTTVQDIPAWEQGYVTNLLGQAQTIAAQPYQQYPGQQVAGFTPDQTQGFSNVEGQQANINPLQSAATGQSAAGANTANNIYGAGAGDINASTMAASPMGIQQYMSPYTNSVVQGIQNEANLNWNQNIMPGINNEFVNAGQGASGRNAQVLGQAAGNFQTGLSSNIANALQSGYTTAGNQAATEAGLLGSAGSTLGNLAATQSGAQQAAGTNLQGLATAQNQTALTNNQALEAVGTQQQAQNQTNLNTAQANWQNQVNWPASQTEYLNQIVRGLPAPTATTSASQGPVNSVSPLSGLGGTSLSVAGLGALTGKEGGIVSKYAIGGNVKAYADGGSVDDDNISGMSTPLDYANLPDTSAAPDVSAPEPTPPPSPLDMPAQDTTSHRNPLLDMSENAPMQNAFTPEKMQSLQLLAMARGLLTPQPMGQAFSALGQGLGNMEDVTMKGLQMQQQQNMLNYNMNMDRQRLGIEQQKADALSANSQEQRIKQLMNTNPGMTYDQASAKLAGNQASTFTGTPAVPQNRYGLPIGTIPEGTSAPVIDPKYDPIPANASPSVRANMEAKTQAQLEKDNAAAATNNDAIARLTASKNTIMTAPTGGITNLLGVGPIATAFSTQRQEMDAMNKELAMAPGERPTNMRLTQGEVIMLKQAQPGTDKSPEANAAIADANIAIRSRPSEWANFKNDFIANNGYWNDAVGQQMYNKYINDNPIIDVAKSGNGVIALNPNRMSLEDYANNGGFARWGVKGNGANSASATPSSSATPSPQPDLLGAIAAERARRAGTQ